MNLEIDKEIGHELGNRKFTGKTRNDASLRVQVPQIEGAYPDHHTIPKTENPHVSYLWVCWTL